MSMPSYWYGAGPDFSGLANAQASQGQTNAYLANQQNTLAQANAYNPWANTPGGFGGQTAYYAGLGAAYGRAVPASSQAAVAAQNPSASVFDTGAKPFEHYGGVGGLQMFDPNKYLSQNRDVWEAGADPWQHYNQFGAKEGRQGAWGDFNAGGYLAQNPDVAASGMDPAAHWFQYGQKEGRQGSGLEPWFGASNQPAQPQPQQQQQLAGDWNSYFNTVASGKGGVEAEYLLANPDVAAAARQAGGDINAFADQHYLNFGQKEGRKFFDANAYYQQNPDVWETGANPFQHYNQFGKAEGRAAPMTSFDARWYGEQNPDVVAAGMDPAAHWFQYGQNEGRFGSNPLVSQRQSYADRVRDDPSLSLNLAARLYSEDQNNPDTRTAIMEAMMNRMFATKQDPLNPGYYPKDPTAYNQAFEKVSSNNDLLNQIHQEMERAFGGSNLSNYATDWASAGVADSARNYATPTWTSPTNEQFFRKDINNPTTGAGIAAQNKAWYDSVTKSIWPKR